MRRVVASSLLVLALAACGKGDGTTVTADGGSSSPSSIQSDHAAAERVLVKVTDLPGYDALPASDAQPQAVKGAASFESCAGVNIALGDPERTALSPAFFKGTTNAVSSLAIVASNEADAETALAGLGRADVAPCLTSLFRTVLDLDLLPGTTAKTEPLPSAKVSDESVTWRTTMQIAMNGQTIPAYADLTFFRKGRTVASLFNFQVGQPFPATDRTKLLDAMVARI